MLTNNIPVCLLLLLVGLLMRPSIHFFTATTFQSISNGFDIFFIMTYHITESYKHLHSTLLEWIGDERKSGRWVNQCLTRSALTWSVRFTLIGREFQKCDVKLNYCKCPMQGLKCVLNRTPCGVTAGGRGDTASRLWLSESNNLTNSKLPN